MRSILWCSIYMYTCICMYVYGKTREEWRSRVIYQVLTDRFSSGDEQQQQEECSDLRRYCGGTFKGIQQNLDYIQGMGFDAIWISPVIENIDEYQMGYHGYHAKNFYKINPKFGTEQDLLDLVEECHKRDIWVMVDVVANHVGPMSSSLNYSIIYPFNKTEYYHEYCPIKQEDYLYHQNIVEDCWLLDLPDLNTSHPYVQQELNQWVKWLVQMYSFDGIRIDTIPYVPKEFWKSFSQSSGVFSLGENSVYGWDYVFGYLGYMDSVLNYPGYYVINDTFRMGKSFLPLREYLKNISDMGDRHYLGSFLDNHDNPRFLSSNPNINNLQNAIVFIFAQYGIPIIYYGTEQAFSGGMDPFNRESFWGYMDSNSELYAYIKILIKARQLQKWYTHEIIESYSSDDFYAFYRDKSLFCLSNTEQTIIKVVTRHLFEEGSVICNIFNPEEDCVKVSGKMIPVVLTNGQPKVYLPRTTTINLL